jgi:hypothetical protein
MDYDARISELEAQVQELSRWKAARQLQQLVHPVDDISKAVLGAFIDAGAASGIATTQSVSVGSVPSSITVPRTPSGVRLVSIGGAKVYVPYFLS